MSVSRSIETPPPALAMWLASSIGMTVGLAIDCRSTTLSALATLCTSGPLSLEASLARHFALLPATNIGMLLGGFAALAAIEMHWRQIDHIRPCAMRIGTGLACNLAMLAGMSVACSAGSALAARYGFAWSGAAMLSAMTAGMTAGMTVATAIARLVGSSPKAWRLA